MPSVPNNLALDNIAPGAEIRSQPLRDNFSDIQAEFNKVVALMDGGSVGQVFTKTSSTEADWQDASAPASSVPAGCIAAYAGAAAPTGWLLCDGSAVSRTIYADLFTAISTTYGVGDGTTTFNLPDLRGRVAVGKGSNTSVDTLGESEASSEPDRRPQHKHTVTLGANTTVGGGGGSTHLTRSALFADYGSIEVTVGPQTNVPTDTPAYLVLNYIVKT